MAASCVYWATERSPQTTWASSHAPRISRGRLRPLLGGRRDLFFDGVLADDPLVDACALAAPHMRCRVRPEAAHV